MNVRQKKNNKSTAYDTSEHFINLTHNIEKYFNREANLEVFNLSKWQKIKKENAPFYQEIMQNHILLMGSELP